MLTDVAMLGDRSEIKKETEKMIKPYNINTGHVERTNKRDTSNNRGNWNHLKIIQKIPQQHTANA